MRRCLVLLFIFTGVIGKAQPDMAASYALINRILPRQAACFIVEAMPGTGTGKDIFEIESRKDKIILRGNSGVAIASALYYYLTSVALFLIKVL